MFRAIYRENDAGTCDRAKGRSVMGSVTGVLAVLFLGTVTVSGLPLTLEKHPPPNNPELSKSYYPPPESAGGWRRCKNDEEVRSLAGMDPQKLDQVGRE